MSILPVVALVMALTPPDYDTRYFDVREMNNVEGCALTGDWELAGRSTIYVQVELATDGELAVSATSYGWSRPAPDAIKLLGLSIINTHQPNQIFSLAGIATTTRPGLVASIPVDRRQEFLQAFASGKSLNIYMADIPPEGEEFKSDSLSLVLQAGLTGSSDAVSSLRRCVSDVKRREDARRAREARVDHITKDPFAD